MGALTGLLAGLGIVLVWWSIAEPQWRPTRHAARRRGRMTDLLARAGVEGIAPAQLAGLCVIAFIAAAALMTGASGVPSIGLVFGLMAGGAPIALLRGRAARRLREHAAVWPDAVDNLTSAVRAGLSLPEALRIAREVGGGDLGRMLRSLSGFLRDDLRTRGEIESRQSWTVNGARLAVAAPWLVLLLMCLQGDVVRRFATGIGLIVLLVGGALCVVAYRLMMWIGRLPAERRILA